MKKQSVRVIVASEDAGARFLLGEMVKRQGGVTVGQAQDAPRALSLVRHVKPDIAIIDAYLPYAASLHTLPLSRVGGLDIAQKINQEAPDTEVVLLNNLDTAVSDRALVSRDGVAYSMKTIESKMPLLIRNLRKSEKNPDNLFFADVEAKSEEVAKPKATNPFDLATFLGACGIALGWFLIIAMISFTIGIAMAAAGTAVVIFSVAGKFIVSFGTDYLKRKSGR